MLAENKIETLDIKEIETLSSYLSREDDYSISHKAMFTAFKYRSKVEFLRFFIV